MNKEKNVREYMKGWMMGIVTGCLMIIISILINYFFHKDNDIWDIFAKAVSLLIVFTLLLLWEEWKDRKSSTKAK